MSKPALAFKGRVIDRSGGGPGGAKSVMKRHPRWPEFIKSFTGWPQIREGTLTLEDCDPRPGTVLRPSLALATDPDPELLFSADPDYVRRMRARGMRRYYGGIATANGRRASVVISQQDCPASITRLEVYAADSLREELQIKTDDRVQVEVYQPGHWWLLPEQAESAKSASKMLITLSLNDTPDAMAPDGSEVRLLATASRGSMAHFKLPPGAVSKAVAHKTVEEVWYIAGGRGRMWRKLGAAEEITELSAGISLAIPVGTHFQFRCDGMEPLEAVGVTMPPWPGMDEAYEVEGVWRPRL